MNARRVFVPLILFLVSSVVAFVAGEVIVRWTGHHDADGTFHFLGRPVRPFALPVHKTQAIVDQYSRSTSSFLVYDPWLGWRPRPNARSEDGLYRSNSAGLRAEREFAAGKRPGTFRVSMFGDSFVFGSDVELRHSPAVQLEAFLRQKGLDAEILNFGVGGYGFDQAYLRHQRESAQFDTDVIVAGLQLENIGRNVTLIRIVAVPGTVIPFSKPRYILRNGSLQIINQPAVPPRDVPATLASFRNWPLAQYEGSFKERYEPRWYTRSVFLRTLVEFWKGRHGLQTPIASDLYDPDGEGMDLTVRLLELWRADVERSGKRFVLVYLPRADAIRAGVAGKADPWQPHRDRLRGYTIADPTQRLVRYAREHGTERTILNHYTPDGYRLVAEALAETLIPIASEERAILPPSP
jgi:hypothetical protein